MFGTVTALLPTGSGSSIVSAVAGQITADAPELLAVLGGLFAIFLVIRLLRKFMHHR